MADVKWIKMIVGMFDGISFKKIKRAKIGGESYRDKLTAVWFELLDLAGRCNHNGALVETDGIPFTDLGDIAAQIDRDEDELELCMTFYLKERMVTIVADAYTITNWCIFQNVEGMEKIREQNRIRQKRWYDKQKELPNVSPNANLTLPNALEEERREEKNLDIDLENERKNESSLDHSSDTDKVNLSTELSTLEDTKRKMIGGELGRGVVFLSKEQMDDLLEKLSIEEFDHYVGVVADCILKGKPFTKKTHYQAILDMAIADRKVN